MEESAPPGPPPGLMVWVLGSFILTLVIGIGAKPIVLFVAWHFLAGWGPGGSPWP